MALPVPVGSVSAASPLRVEHGEPMHVYVSRTGSTGTLAALSPGRITPLQATLSLSILTLSKYLLATKGRIGTNKEH